GGQDFGSQGYSGNMSNMGYRGENYGSDYGTRSQGQDRYNSNMDMGQEDFSGLMNDQGEQSWQRRGQHTGRGPKGYTRSDDRIMEDVCERLTQHGNIDASEITVQVNNGE